MLPLSLALLPVRGEGVGSSSDTVCASDAHMQEDTVCGCQNYTISPAIPSEHISLRLLLCIERGTLNMILGVDMHVWSLGLVLATDQVENQGRT